MSSNPRLPPELCDRIIDQLRDRPKALRVCSVVSKSWTSRSRKHIFSTVSFNGDRDIVAWGNAFPDPSNSPAHHARQLVVSYRGEFPENHLVSFCNVTCLLLHVHAFNGRTTSLTQLHGFTPLLKSLTMSFHVLPFTDVLSLVYSFPLLDDLTLIGLPTASDTKITSPVSPMFSGKLYLAVVQAMGTVVDDLLSLPSGIHFRELIMHWMCEEDLPSMMDLISACSRTLEDLQILNHAKQENIGDSLDLSSVTNLRSIDVHCGMSSFNVDWITAAVESIRSPHVKEMCLHTPRDLTTREEMDGQLSDTVHAQWLALDKVLVKYLTARSFKLKVEASSEMDDTTFEACVERLLPDLFGKKMIEMA